MLINWYPIHSEKELQSFLYVYVPFCLNFLDTLNIDINIFKIEGDHLGLQCLSSEEFDSVDKKLLKFSKLVNAGVIHNRRNNIYLLNNYIKVGAIEIKSVEIFEPKPDADVTKLKPGIEHISLISSSFDDLYSFFTANGLPVDKISIDGIHKFFKTKLINMIEIEFRNEFLYKKFEN